MAVRSYDEIMESIRKRLGEDNSDEALSFIEDVSDTLKESQKNDTDDWKKKFEENDKMWRERYKNRFFNVGEDKDLENEYTGNQNKEPEVEDESPKEFDDLFETK